jgi:Cu+-exporting ATPase
MQKKEGQVLMQSRYRVTGMGCEACVKRVEKAVSALVGVERAMVDLSAETLTVEYDESKVSFDTLKNAVDEAGYGLEEI